MKELTTKQAIIADHIVAGLTDAEIAYETGLSIAGVRTHIRVLFQRYGTNNRTRCAVLHSVNSVTSTLAPTEPANISLGS